MTFNGIDQQTLLSSLSPLTRNMWREAQKRKPFLICSRRSGLAAVVFEKNKAAALARTLSTQQDHYFVKQ
jgi:hypothetical protein